jgi:hypothetical protein
MNKRIRRPSPSYRANAQDINAIGGAANMLRRLSTGAEPLQVARELARTHATRLSAVFERMTSATPDAPAEVGKVVQA